MMTMVAIKFIPILLEETQPDHQSPKRPGRGFRVREVSSGGPKTWFPF